MDIREYLDQYKLLTDGAMGTYFDESVHGEFVCSEEANYTAPEKIAEIHLKYLKSGARLIRSNTFSCNHPTLEELKKVHPKVFSEIGLKDFIKTGYRIAEQCVTDYGRDDVFFAADIGPIPEDGSQEERIVEEEYQEICDAFLEEGADTFVLETFPSARYPIFMAEYIRKKNPNAFIIAQFSFAPTGYSGLGKYYKNVIRKASESNLFDAVGLNCGIGASHTAKFLESLIKEEIIPDGTYITALPNCGYPRIVRGRAVYSDSPVYFGEQVKTIAHYGANIIGGCCGTTPECIAQISKWLHGEELVAGYAPMRPEPVKIVISTSRKEEKEKPVNLFREKIEKGQSVFAVELDPPFDANVEKLLNGASLLKDSLADIITIADSPLARSRADSILMSTYIKNQTGMQVMPHIACRDRNKISLRSAFLGAHIHGIRNTLLVTGDPVGASDRSYIKSVFDYNSIKLMESLKEMNVECFEKEPFFYGGALNQNGKHPEAIAKRMKLKMEQGCSYFMSQPVYSKAGIERLRYLKEETGANILVGVMPLVSYRNAWFIQNEMPGIDVPDEVLNRYPENGTKEEWEKTAVDISLSVMQESKDFAGYYFMTPFNRVALIKKILDKVEIDEQGRII